MPRRVATGIDPKRLAMIVAVLSRHARVALGQADVFVNVAGGVRIDEPGADLAVALAIASAARRDPGEGGRRGVRRDRPHRPPPSRRAGRAAARGMRQARPLGRRRSDRNGRDWQNRGRGRRDAAAGDQGGARWRPIRRRRPSAKLSIASAISASRASPRRKTRAARTPSSSPRSPRSRPAPGSARPSTTSSARTRARSSSSATRASSRSSTPAASSSMRRFGRSSSTSSRRWTARSSSTRRSNGSHGRTSS